MLFRSSLSLVQEKPAFTNIINGIGLFSARFMKSTGLLKINPDTKNELKEKAKSYGLIGLAYLSVKQAIDAVLSETESDDFIFIGGSNFVVGEALPLFEK